ncbi:DUF4410 domain-containing protein [Dyella flagellata]|uniref:DUF4410 domain-containing protein n=1 Tax=Dyella flagellata TaxID=1867833 RepID=A0ABQ5XB21_9GAMM|nr:DUF4410 domain-containing protein [Dyella flagellata]GLQ87823.1 hypothetical protein GCM10007898_13910 [Dyella flagellata]
MKIRFRYLSIVAVWSAFVVSTCFAATETAPPPKPNAPVVYVSNFELDAAPAQAGQATRGVLGRGGLLHRNQDPQAQAQEMVSLMSDTLTQDLKKAGIDARRTLPGAELPKTGWNVHGVFLSVDQGNVARRAMIGFGAGHSSLQVAAAVDDLAKPGQAPLQTIAEGNGGHMPGAIIMLNPYAIAAKVVLAGRDQDKAIKNAAKQIAQAVVQRVQTNVAAPVGTPVTSPSIH